MKKLFILAFSSLILLSACQSNKSSNNSVPTVTPTIVEPGSRPDKEVVATFEQEGFKLELFYENGTYMYFGTISLPTPCYIITSDIVSIDTNPPTAEIAFTTSDTAQEGISCVQVITEKTIYGEFLAEANAQLKVILNGEEVPRTK